MEEALPQHHLFTLYSNEEYMQPKNNSKTILVIVVGVSLLYAYFKTKNGSLSWETDYILYLIVGIGLLSLISSRIESAIIWVWFKIAELLGWINTRIILTLVFFLFLTPIALLRKVFSKKDPMKLRNKYSSTYVERDHTYVAKDLDNIW